MSDVFQSLLKDRIENDNISMFIIDAPTGSGKSFQIGEYIKNNYKNKKIIFLANQHNQMLSDEDITRDLEEQDKEKILEKTLRLKSIKDTFIENFNINILPTDFYDSNREICKELDTVIKMLIDKSLSKDYIKYYNNKFYDQEKIFRDSIKMHINKNSKKGINNRKKYIMSQKWICKLYPSVYLKDKSIIFMTVQKFFRPIDPLYERPYELINITFDNAIIFFDEFDASKKIILNILINDNIKNYKIECFRLFRRLYDEVLRWNIPKYLHVKKPKDGYEKEELIKNIEAQVSWLQDKFKKIYKETDSVLSNSFKTKDIENNHNFIFNDNDIQTITKKKDVKKLVYHLGNQEDEKTNVITELTYKNVKEDINKQRLDYLYQKVNNAIADFLASCATISENYMHFVNANLDKNSEKINFTSACNGIISILNLGEENERFLTQKVVQNLRDKKSKKKFNITNDKKLLESNDEFKLIKKFENDKRRSKYDFYKDGFSFMDVVDSLDSHSLESRVYSYSYDIVPEKIIVNLCVNYKVIGVSATATVESVLTNYDLSYFRQILKDRISFCNEQERDLLMNEYNLFLGETYKNKKISVDFTIDQEFRNINSEVEYLKATLVKILGNDDLYYLHQVLEENKEENKCKEAADLYNVFYRFCNECHVQSFIYFTNFYYKDNKNFYKASKEVLEKIKSKFKSVSIEIFVLNINEFNNMYKDKVLKALEFGEKVFIITTFQTLGVGVNLKYKLTRENEKYYSNLKYEETNIVKKDFDGIYITKPTNIFPNFNFLNHNYESFIEVIYALEYLGTVDSLKKKDVIKYLKTAFRIEYMNQREKLIFPHDHINDIQNGVLRCLIQAVGRICRTRIKGDKILILSCYDNAKILWRTQNVQKDLNLNIEFKELSRHACEFFSKNANYFITDIEKANKVESHTKYTINGYLFNKWTDITVKLWKELREIVLKYPTSNCLLNNAAKDFYIEFNEEIKEYSFDGYNWKRFGNEMCNYRLAVSERASRLNRFMKIPGLQDYFDENGYSTSFKPSKYIMSPTLFNNIYKGALGECAGQFILNKYNIEVQEINDNNFFEYFDFCYGEKICFDFKNWSRNFNKDLYKQLKWIRYKAKKAKYYTVFVINILFEGYCRIETYDEEINNNDRVKIITVPWLFNNNSENLKFNEDAIVMIKEEIERWK
ncbi:hypothetical protein [Thomasclavelia spiroformis]|uniref:hypothetical protein n=1 Tax=Thomasclavelia spiroformis TaxID=29348 RepID=UPI00241E2219|nr:hypothetical protein [Thomasclavelia spiroformis]MBS6115098.1 hypothetical protein [Thomasclavelia spiroformis]